MKKRVSRRLLPPGYPESAPPKRKPFANGAEGCVRETRKGVLHDDDPHFSELFKVLKNASACRKDYFDTLTGRKHLLPACEPIKKVRAFRQRGGRVCAGNPGRVSCTMMIPIFQNFLKL